MRQHLENQPEPPSIVNPNIPKTIDTVILRALSKKPEDRFGSIEAFSTTFQRLPGPARAASGPIRPSMGSSAGGSGDQPKSPDAATPPPPGNDIHATLVINPTEAQRGTNKTLNFGGRNVIVSVPPNAYNGQVLHIEGQGEPSHAGGPAGTLHVNINVTQYQQVPPPPPVRAVKAVK